MLITDYFDTEYRPRRLLGRSKDTTRLYHCSIRAFGRTLGHDPTLADLTNNNMTRHMQARLDAGLSAATANKDRNQLLAIWRQAQRDGLIDVWPDVQLLVEPQRTPTAWSAIEVAAIYRAIKALRGNVGDVSRSLWWLGLVQLGLDTGERIGALRQTRWDWISNGWINFPAEARKGGRRDRAYKLSDETLKTLFCIQQQCGGDVAFPWPHNPTYIWNRYKIILEMAGLPANRRTCFHQLRRTVASAVYAAGLDPQDALDHSDRRTTQRYLDPRFQRNRAACDVLAEFLANPKKREEDKERKNDDRESA